MSWVSKLKLTLTMGVVLSLIASHPSWAAPRQSVQVVGVIDGDTIHVLHQKREKVRLAFIDAPEMNQPYGQASKQALSRMIFGKTIDIERHDIDQYGRTIATLWLDNQDINLEMVAQGHAWVYRRYNRNPVYVIAETKAKGLKKGLWRLEPRLREAPWQWRKQEAKRKNKK